MKAKYGLSNVAAASAKGADVAINLGKAMGQAASAMYQGKKGAAAFNDSVDSLTSAALAATAALALLGGPIGLFAAAVGLGIAAFGAYTKAANEMSDKLYKGYQGLAESGAAASDGMTGLFEDAKKLGLSMNDLAQYTGLIAANSKDLALFSGSVYQGRQAFADVVEGMDKFKEGLMNTGLSQEQINAGAMGYLKLQSRIGQSQNKSTQELAEGTNKYLLEMDALSKITGETRKGMEDTMEAARSEERFAGKLQELRAAGRVKEAHELEIANVMLASQSKQAAQGFRDLSTGMINTDAAQKLYIATQGKAMVVSDKISANQMKAAEAVTVLGRAAGDTAKNNTFLAKAGVFGDVFGDFNGYLKLGIYTQRNLSKEQEKAEAEIEKSRRGMDPAVKAQSELTIKQQKANEATERFIKAGIVGATEAMGVLADATTGAANKLNELAGIKTTTSGRTPGGGTSQQPRSQPGSQMGPTKPGSGGNLVALADKPGGAPAAPAGPAPSRPMLGMAAKFEWDRQYGKTHNTDGTPVGSPAAAPAAAPAAKATSSKPVSPRAVMAADSDRFLGKNKPAAESAPAQSAAPVTSYSDQLLNYIKSTEQFTAKAFWDFKQYTNGYGTKANGPDEVITKEEAENRLTNSLQSAVSGVISYGKNKKYNWTQGQIDALTSFSYNAGIGRLDQLTGGGKRSSEEIATKLLEYNKATDSRSGKIVELSGLTKRRQEELAMFKQAKKGGMFNGPSSGYPMTMHGPEAVIPLENGAVPVSLSTNNLYSGFDAVAEQLNGLTEQVVASTETTVKLVADEFKSALSQMSQTKTDQGNSGMTEMLMMLSELVAAAKSGNDISTKILRQQA